MKKKKIKQIIIPDYEKKECLFEMFKVYENEPDMNKRDALRLFIREYWLSNPMIIYDNLEEKKIFLSYIHSEESDLNERLKNFQIYLDDLAIVSVKTRFNEILHPSVDDARVQILTRYDKAVDHNFDKGEIWEYAVLSKDMKSFVLLRDLFDKKIQPIENCFVYNQTTVGEMIKANNCVKKYLCPQLTTYTLNGLENLRSFDYFFTEFDDKEVNTGVIGVERLFIKNFNVYVDQIYKKMNERQAKFEKEQDKLNNECTDRKTFEF